MDKGYPPAGISWLIWALGASFYFTAFYHRVAPAVLNDLLMAEFRISAAALGNLTAFYFYSYFVMQIPTGILADRWGPRRLLTAGSLVAGAGTLLFATADTPLLANLGRLLLGGAAGVAYVSILALAGRWFPARFFATVSGLTLCCGVAGAVTAGPPLRFLVEAFGWRQVLAAAAGVHLIIAAAIWRLVRDDPAQRGYRTYAPPPQRVDGPEPSVVRGLLAAFGFKNILPLALVGCGMTGSVLAFAGLWGVPFFSSLYGLQPAMSSLLTSLLLVSYAVGAVVLGVLSDRMARRKIVLLSGAAAGAAAWTALLVFPALFRPLVVPLVILLGFACGSVTVGFAYSKESVPPNFAGTASGIYNMGSTLGVIILQPAIGWLLDLFWQGEMKGGVRVYGLEEWRIGFAPLIALAALSIFFSALTKETHGRQRKGDEKTSP